MKLLADIGKNQSIRYYKQYYRLISLAVLITVAIIVGSLLIGHSVRQTLIHRVTERLGKVETVIFSRNAFLSDSILYESLFSVRSQGVLLSDGFISHNGQLLPVMVWGLDDNSLMGRALINQPLADELHLTKAEEIVLRLPKGGLVPSGSLFVTDNYTVGLRLEQAGIKSANDGGNISLKNEQSLPLNVFVCRDELAEVMEVKGKINLILLEDDINESALADVWKPTYSGIKVRNHAGVGFEYKPYTEVTTDRVFLQSAVVDHINQLNRSVNPLYSYLANSISLDDKSIPYSFVTAIREFGGHHLSPDEILLSDYAAQRLQAHEGDTINVSFYVSKGLKDLKTDSVFLRVGGIIPLRKLTEDGALSAEFPGLSDVERCTDWDSDLPLDMSLITDEDEDYWNQYRSTPKALLPYDLMKGEWSNDYGVATALRIYDQPSDVEGLQLSMFDVQIVHPRESGMYAARNGIDFASLFFALGFFIILSALLLLISPLDEMLWQRKAEIQLLKAIGYSNQRIINMFCIETLPVVVGAAILGVIAGILYTAAVMWLLGNIWNGVTQTSNLGIYIDVGVIIWGLVTGVILTFVSVYCLIFRSVSVKHTIVMFGKGKNKQVLCYACGLSLMSIIVFLLNVLYIDSLYLFVGLGLLLVLTAGAWGEYVVWRKSHPGAISFDTEVQVYSTLLGQLKQLRISYYALAFGVFTVFAVGLNHQQVSDLNAAASATGGYNLWAESSVPVYYDLNTKEGRHQMSLDELPAQTVFLQTLRLSADDASCLNLNKVTQPTVLGIDVQELQKSTFEVSQSLYADGFKSLGVKIGYAYPVLIDQESLTWSLGMGVGDTLHYQKANGEQVDLIIAGALKTGVFQGYALMDKHLFKEIWPEIGGSDLLLVKTDQPEQVRALLSQALHEYGIRVMTTAQRLNGFNELVNTYLGIFMSLGGIGMLLGIMSFIIVIRKSLLVRRHDISLYHSIGYSAERIGQLLVRENVLLPLYAVLIGTLAALMSVWNNFSHNGWSTWLQVLILLLLFVGLIMWFVRSTCRKAVADCLTIDAP